MPQRVSAGVARSKLSTTEALETIIEHKPVFHQENDAADVINFVLPSNE